jgi:serine/threonine protein kinase
VQHSQAVRTSGDELALLVGSLIDGGLSDEERSKVLQTLGRLSVAHFREVVSLVEDEEGTLKARLAGPDGKTSLTRGDLIDRLVGTLPQADGSGMPPGAGKPWLVGVGRAWLLAFMAWVAEHRGSVRRSAFDHEDVFAHLLAQPPVCQAFCALYAPDGDAPGPPARRDLPAEKAGDAPPGHEPRTGKPSSRDNSSEFWRTLNFSTVQFHAFGTTSFILKLSQKGAPVGGASKGTVALKCLQTRFASNHPVRKSARSSYGEFQGKSTEAEAAVYASTEQWVAMEFIPGPTLREWLDQWRNASIQQEFRDPSSPPREQHSWAALDVLADIAVPLAAQLATIHERGRFHGDLTPRNVILRGDVHRLLPIEHASDPPTMQTSLASIEGICLVDFGTDFASAHLIDANYPESSFIPPERAPSIRGDAYSLGRIIRELLSKREPSGPVIGLAVYRDHPLVGRLLEDLLDPDPRRRLLLDLPTHQHGRTDAGHDAGPGGGGESSNGHRALSDSLGALSVPPDAALSAGLALRLAAVVQEEKRLAPQSATTAGAWSTRWSRLQQAIGFRSSVGRLWSEWCRERDAKNQARGQTAPAAPGNGAGEQATAPDTETQPSSVLSMNVARLAVWSALSAAVSALMFDITVGGFVTDYMLRAPKFLQWVFSFSDAVSLGGLRGRRAPVGNVSLNGPAHLVVFSFVLAGLAYYQVIFAFVGPLGGRRRGGSLLRRARRVNALGRMWAVLTLLLVGFGNLFEPAWWLGIAALGMCCVALTNTTAWRFEEKVWQQARLGLEVSPADAVEFRDPGRDMFRNWGISSSLYAAALAALFVLRQAGLLHDMGVYEVTVLVANIVLLYLDGVVRFGPTVRARLMRAFVFEERLDVARQLNLLALGYDRPPQAA